MLRKMQITRSFTGVAAAAVVLAGCQDLNVPNTNDPDRLRALTSAEGVETLAISAWRDQWAYLHNTVVAFNTMPLIADEVSATYANDAALELSSEPRVPLNNTPSAAAHAVANSPWFGFYKGISSVNDGMAAIDGGLAIVTGEPAEDRSSTLWAWSKWMSGILHGHLGMMFDQAFIHHHTADLEFDLPLVEYTAVRDTAIKYLLESVDSMKAKPFIIPENWIPQRTRTSAELIQIAHSYIAQFYVYGARTPEERAALPWQTILSHIEQGITSDYEIDLSNAAGWNVFTNILGRHQIALTNTFGSGADYKLIGPADVSGRYAAWLAAPLDQREKFFVVTPDRRITGDGERTEGMYFRPRTVNIFAADRGVYHHSEYQFFRKKTGGSNSGVWPLISLDEMNLMRAEALYYLDRRTEAAQFTNISRTRNRVFTVASSGFGPGAKNFPGLPAVTADGVPQSADCVPRMDGVTCANLLDAIMYERMIEGALLHGYRGYFDSRGWGRLPPGTFLHAPIPARELVALGMAPYTFGGVGNPGSAR
jgi:starch-binding outer membrane protein, SusD/RagB family